MFRRILLCDGRLPRATVNKKFPILLLNVVVTHVVAHLLYTLQAVAVYIALNSFAGMAKRKYRKRVQFSRCFGYRYN